MSGPPPPPRRRNLNYQVNADTGAGSAMNAVKLKQRQTMKVSPSKPMKPLAKAPPRVQQIVTSSSGQINYSKKTGAKYNTGAIPNSWGTALDTARSDNTEVDELVLRSQSRYLYDNDQRSQEYEFLLDESPETSVGAGVDIRGELQFERLLRIDGKFEGKITSQGSIVVGRQGCLIGDLAGIDCLIVDGGRVVGDVNVERLVLRGTGSLTGSCVCKSLKMGPHCTIIASANVHALAPEVIDIHGDIVVDEPEVDMSPLDMFDLEDDEFDEGDSGDEGGDDDDDDGDDGNGGDKKKHKHKHKHKHRHKHKGEGNADGDGEDNADGDGEGNADGDGEGNADGEGKAGGDDEAAAGDGSNETGADAAPAPGAGE